MALGLAIGLTRPFVSTGDADAAAYISAVTTAGGSFDYTAVNASYTPTYVKGKIQDLFSALKAAGVWSNLVCFLPFIGKTAASHAICAKSLNTITWNGTVTHDATGVTSDGTTGYGVMSANLDTLISVTSASLFAYRRISESTGSSRCIIGSEPTGAYGQTGLGLFSGGSLDNGSIAGDNYTTTVAPTTNTGVKAGMLHVTSNGSRRLRYYLNGTQAGNDNTVTPTLAIRPVPAYILAANSGAGAVKICAKAYQLIGIGSFMDDTRSAAFATAVVNFQTALGRN